MEVLESKTKGIPTSSGRIKMPQEEHVLAREEHMTAAKTKQHDEEEQSGIEVGIVCSGVYYALRRKYRSVFYLR